MQLLPLQRQLPQLLPQPRQVLQVQPPANSWEPHVLDTAARRGTCPCGGRIVVAVTWVAAGGADLMRWNASHTPEIPDWDTDHAHWQAFTFVADTLVNAMQAAGPFSYGGT